ncbi:MAG: CopD family protein [Dehalococcoidia bacterium]
MHFQLSVYIHVLAAITWIGGMVFLAVVLVPLSKGIKEPPGLGVRVLGIAARRFRIVGWIALLTLVGSGIWILSDNGISPSDIATGHGSYFQALRIKVALVAALLTISILHDFMLGPRLARKLEALRGPVTSSPPLMRQRMAIAWLARTNLLLALAVVAFGVILG